MIKLEAQINLTQFNSIKGLLEVEQRCWGRRLENDPIWSDEISKAECKGRIGALEGAIWIVQQHLKPEG